MADMDEKATIEHEIVRARNDFGQRIDELDRTLRTNYDPGTLARNYAPQLVAGGAVLGVLVGFGAPKVFRKLVTWGVPLAIVGMTLKNVRERKEAEEARTMVGLA
jgi:hypothetical protein